MCYLLSLFQQIYTLCETNAYKIIGLVTVTSSKINYYANKTFLDFFYYKVSKAKKYFHYLLNTVYIVQLLSIPTVH